MTTLLRPLALAVLVTALLPAEDHFYRLVTRNIQDGSNYSYYVKSELDPAQLAERMDAGKTIRFPVTYAWRNQQDTWVTWQDYDGLFTSELLIKGSDILLVQTLTRDPTTISPKPAAKETKAKAGDQDKAGF